MSRFLVGGSGGTSSDQSLNTYDSVNFVNISASSDVSARNITATGTLTAKEIISDLKIRDALIESAFGNVADTINAGVFSTYNDGVDQRFSGLIRSKDTKNFHLLDGITEPTPTNNLSALDLSAFHCADVFCGDVEANLMTVNSQIPANTFSLPSTRGTVGQLVESKGDGSTDWADPPASAIMQDVYDNSIAPQIETDAINPSLSIKQGGVAEGSVFSIINKVDADVIVMGSDGSFYNTGEIFSDGITRLRDVRLMDAGNSNRWYLTNDESTDNFLISSATLPLLTITQTGDVEVTKLLTDTIDEKTASAGITIDGVLMKDGGITTSGQLTITDEITYLHKFEPSQRIIHRSGNFAGGALDLYYRSRGTQLLPTAMLSGDLMSIQFMHGHTGSAYVQGVVIKTTCTENWSTGNTGTSLTVQTNDIGTSTLVDKLIIGDEVTISNAVLNTDLIYQTNGTSYRRDINDGYSHNSRSINAAGGVATNDYRSRGDLTTLTALLVNDLISVYTANGYSGTGFSQGSRMRTRCTENWTLTNRGAEYIIETTNIGATGVTEKLTIGDTITITNADLNLSNRDITNVFNLTADEIGVNSLQIGTGGTAYIFPTVKGAIGEVLYDSDGLGTLAWKAEKISYVVGLGGNLNGVKYAKLWGEANTTAANVLNESTQIVIVEASSLRKIAYNSSAGDATTVMQIYKNGVLSTSWNMVAIGIGVFTLPAPLSLVEGDTFAIQANSGTVPANVAITCYLST